MDTVGDGTASFYTVININGDEVTIKNRDNMKNEKISQKEFVEGKTRFHKIPTPPVKVYNLKDQNPKAEKNQGEPKMSKEKKPDEVRSYLLQIDRILSAAKGIDEEAKLELYDLAQQILRLGFTNEFGEKR